MGENREPPTEPPATIRLIKTTGEEEGRAAYCRGDSIVLPVRQLDSAV